MTFTEEELEIVKKALVCYRCQDWRQIQSVYENEVKPLDELINKLNAWNSTQQKYKYKCNQCKDTGCMGERESCMYCDEGGK